MVRRPAADFVDALQALAGHPDHLSGDSEHVGLLVEVRPAQREKFRSANARGDQKSDRVDEIVLFTELGRLQVDEKVTQLVGGQRDRPLGLALGPHRVGVDDAGHHRKL
jgi:hypothetical protein